MIDVVWAWFAAQAATNDVFSGVVAASLFGSVLYALRAVPARVGRLLVHQTSCEVVVHNDDEAFAWVNEWLAAHPYARRSRRLMLGTRAGPQRDGVRWSLAPGPGIHVLFYRRRVVVLERVSQDPEKGAGMRREMLRVRVFGRSLDVVRDLVEEARALRERADAVDVYVYHHGWMHVGQRVLRPAESVVMPHGQRRALLEDVRWFVGARAWYRARGVPWRRGVLLHGPPGCGKTSLVVALASELGMPVYAINLGSCYTDEQFFGAMATVPDRALVLLEDVDAAQRDRAAPVRAIEDHEVREDPPLTMSGLLNAIDGVASREGRLLVMTTNHPDALDAALVRPGRVDRREHLGPIGSELAAEMYLRFFPGEEAHAAAVRGSAGAVPAAHLQEAFLRWAGDPKRAAWAAADALEASAEEEGNGAWRDRTATAAS